METAISTRNLVKKYRGKGRNKGKTVNALSDLNLDVKVGDIYGFIGPNGAGKTTTIKILVGLISPTSGKAMVMGEPAGTVKSKAKVGYLSEVSHYYPFMEVEKLLDFYCSFYEIPRSDREKRIKEVLKTVGLEEKTNARMKELSKGMMQRFGIAQAIIADPPLLILDELTSGLDPIAQKEVKDIVLKLKQRGKTIFFSSHQMTEVEMICDQIGILYKGNLLKSTNLDEFLREKSGAQSRIKFYVEEDKILNELREQDREINREKENLYNLVVLEEEIDSIIRKIVNSGGNIREISPYHYSLEDAFFNLIKEVRE